MLSVARDFPGAIQKHDFYKGFEYIIVLHKPKNFSYWLYNWYIKLPENHELNPYDFGDIRLPPSEPSFKEKDDETNNYWLGFDSWHYWFLEKQKTWSVEYFEFYALAAIESLIAKTYLVNEGNLE